MSDTKDENEEKGTLEMNKNNEKNVKSMKKKMIP